MAEATQFEWLVQRHEHALYRYALRQLGCEADARDCTQEVLAAAWQAGATRCDPDASMQAWLFRVTKHKVVDVLRQRRRELAARDVDVEVEALRGPLDDPAAFAERERARAAFARLRPEFRQVALLRLVGGLSEAETAARL